MASRKLNFPVFDADNHLYETTGSFTKYLPERYQNAVKYVQVDGRTKIAIRGQLSEYIPNPTFEVVARPGAMEEYYKKGNPEGKSQRRQEPHVPDARLADRGADEGRPRDDPRGHPRPQRVDPRGLVVQLQGPDLPGARDQPADRGPGDRGTELGRRARCQGHPGPRRAAPVPGFKGPRSFAMPEFEPFWSRVEELGLLVAMHSSDSGHARHASEWEGATTEHLPFKPDAFRMLSSWRPIADSVGSWVCHGGLYRHPNLKVAVIENGASWLPPLLAELKHLYKKMPDAFPGGDPVQMVKDRVYISPFWEEDPRDLADLIGTDHILFGSDYPHPEGLAEPTTCIDQLSEFTEEEQALVMGGNLGRLLSDSEGLRG
jgi:predicted TIM-barrel fold metal-dependent hydrolase